MINIFAKSKNTFEGIHDDESVIILVRRHWLILTLQLVGLFFAGFIVILAILILGGYFSQYGVFSIALFLATTCMLWLWFSAFYIITMYFLNTWIVTNHRIIDSRQSTFFSRIVSEVSLGRVQDVSTNVSGLLATFVDYGEIQVQSAGTDVEFKFEEIPHPGKVKETIMQLSATYASPSGMQKHP